MVVACEAVQLAARLCREVQQELTAAERHKKADDSPVTVADYAAQAIISALLAASFPEDALVAEEDSKELKEGESNTLRRKVVDLVNSTLDEDAGKLQGPLTETQVLEAIDRGGSQGGCHGRHWVLDPIDGTKGFMQGRQYAIALALIDEGKVVLGVLGCPNLPKSPVRQTIGKMDYSGDEFGVLFAAQLGGGTVEMPMWGDVSKEDAASRPAHVRTVDDAADCYYMESYGDSIVAAHGFTAQVAARLGMVNAAVQCDSQAKYGAIARGDADVYLRFPPSSYREKIWDHAPAAIVITEAGGVITDASGQPLDFSNGRFLNMDRGIIACAPTLHKRLLNAINEALEES